MATDLNEVLELCESGKRKLLQLNKTCKQTHTGEENCNKRHVSGEGKQREKQSGCKKEWAREAETIGNTFVNNRTQNNAGLLLTRDITSTIAMQRV